MDTKPAWMYDDLVKDIPTDKLDFIASLYQESMNKNQKELLMHLIPLMKKAKSQGLSLSATELNLAINAIKKHSTEEELKKIDSILKKQSPKA